MFKIIDRKVHDSALSPQIEIGFRDSLQQLAAHRV